MGGRVGDGQQPGGDLAGPGGATGGSSMDERWYVETQTDAVSARRELIMLAMAMALVPDTMAAAAAQAAADRGLIAIMVPSSQFRPFTLDLDLGDDGYFMDGYR